MGQAKLPSSNSIPKPPGGGGGSAAMDKFRASQRGSGSGSQAMRAHLNTQADLHARAGNTEAVGHIANQINAMDKAGK